MTEEEEKQLESKISKITANPEHTMPVLPPRSWEPLGAPSDEEIEAMYYDIRSTRRTH